MQTICDVTLTFKRHIWVKNENLNFIYGKSEVKCVFIEENDLYKLKIHIISNCRDDAFDLCLNIFKYLFVALGRVPEINSFIINGESEIENMPSFYIYSQWFDSRDMALFNINKNTFNAKKLNQIELIDNQFPILNSFIALHSRDYENICEDHRVNLLIHSLEGYHRKDHSSDIKLVTRIRDILSELKHYDKKYKIGICRLYTKSLEVLFKDIRNQYSHYGDSKIGNLTNFDFHFCFYVISYSYRLKIIKDIGIKIEDKFVREYYCILYDWINKVNGKKLPFKSNAYKNSKS